MLLLEVFLLVGFLTELCLYILFQYVGIQWDLNYELIQLPDHKSLLTKWWSEYWSVNRMVVQIRPDQFEYKVVFLSVVLNSNVLVQNILMRSGL